MTKKQIESLIENSTLNRDRALKMLREHIDDLQKRNEVSYWMNLYLNHKAEVEWLKKQKPDD